MRLVTIASLGGSAALGLAALMVAKMALPAMAPATAAAAGAPASTPAARGVPVVIAKQDIKFGQKLDASQLTLASLPADVAPQGAFASIDQVLQQDHGGAPVAITAMSAHEPLLPTKLSGPGARASVAAEIAEGMRAYTIKVTDVSGVGGHALPGDRVDVVLTRDLSVDNQKRNLISEVVLQNVRVLGVDLNADLNSNKPATPNTATLEVSVQDAQKLSVAADLGGLSLALRRTGSAEVAPTAPLRTADFVTGGPGAAPITASRAVRRSTPTVRRSTIVVVEGEGEQTRHSVPPAPAGVPSAGLTASATDAAGSGA